MANEDNSVAEQKRAHEY